MINFSTILTRLKATLAFCLPVSHTAFTTNDTPDEEGMVMLVNTPSNPYVAISDGNGGFLTLRSTDVPPVSILSEVAPRIIVDGLVKSRHTNPAFEWEATGEAVDNKRWDFVVQGTSLYLRSLSDVGVVHLALKLTRTDEYITGIEFLGSPVKGLDGIDPTHFATLGQLGTALTIASPNATDLPTAITLVNEMKAKLNAL